MNNHKIIYLLLVFTIIGCADQIVSECDTSNTQDISELTTFTKIQNNILTTNCALSGCHGSISPQANLDLSSGKAYSNLVNVQSELYPALKRVVPGNAANSLLIKVLKGDGVPLMPQSGNLDNSIIDSVSAWINRGAINN